MKDVGLHHRMSLGNGRVVVTDSFERAELPCKCIESSPPTLVVQGYPDCQLAYIVPTGPTGSIVSIDSNPKP